VQVPKFNATYAVIIAGLVGTTIAPWQHFYLQAAVVEKRVGPRQYAHTRNDVLVGSISCMVIVFFIIVCTAATLYVNGIHQIDNAGTAALALKPLAGKGASVLFAIGLLNASIFAASILPLSTAYVVCEALGFESGIDRKLGEAKIFYGLYTAIIILGAGLVLFLGSHANAILLWSQVLNGFLLPVGNDFHTDSCQPARLGGRQGQFARVQLGGVDFYRGSDRAYVGRGLHVAPRAISLRIVPQRYRGFTDGHEDGKSLRALCRV